MYVDGVQDGATVVDTTVATTQNVSDITIGGIVGLGYTTCNIDSFTLFTKTLTLIEVKEMYDTELFRRAVLIFTPGVNSVESSNDSI